MLIEMLLGFVLIRYKFMSYSSVQPLNNFLVKVCYLPMITRNLARQHLQSMSFMPFVISILTTGTWAILLTLLFLGPFKDKFYMYLSTYLASLYVNYLIIGLPLFNSLWGEEENSVVVIQNLSGDLFGVPIYLVLMNIYTVQRNNKRHEEANDGEVEKLSWKLVLDILIRIITNPFIIGNILGFIYSSTGWKMCPYLDELMMRLQNAVLQLCLFCVGGFLSQRNIIACHWAHFIGTILIRHIGYPLVGALYCAAFGLSARLSRQILIMCCLPAATASFLLSNQYDTGPGVASTSILWTTLLCIPFMVAWLFVLDKLGIFIEE